MAGPAFVEELALDFRHLLSLGVSAMRAGQDGFEKNLIHGSLTFLSWLWVMLRWSPEGEFVKISTQLRWWYRLGARGMPRLIDGASQAIEIAFDF
jgi:hypothetical protein